MIENVKAVIFDLDGTLIDTEKIYRMVWPLAMEELGYVFTDENYLKLRSMGRPFAPKWFKSIYGEDFDYDNARRVRKGYFDRYVENHPIERKKGAIELLEYLKGKGIITAIATATDLDRATEYLKVTGLYDYFDKVISATMVEYGKPEPLVYLYACEQLNLKPSECVAVEDAPNGITSAYKAGLKVIMVPDASQPDEEDKKKIYCSVNSLDEIIKIV